MINTTFLLLLIFFIQILVFGVGFVFARRQKLSLRWKSNPVFLVNIFVIAFFVIAFLVEPGIRLFFLVSESIPIPILFFITPVPLIVWILHASYKYSNHYAVSKDDPDSFLIPHQAIKKLSEDKLGFQGLTETIVKCLWNNDSKDPIVLGVDAPWGSGKTSLFEFCRTEIKKDSSKDIMIAEISCLNYKGRETFFVEFIEKLIHAIQKEKHVPKLNILFRRYLKALLSIKYSTLSGILFDSDSEVIYDKLKAVLQKANFKMVVIIDDLDRLTSDEIKNILFSIKKVFFLPNISFLVCYDSNIVSNLKTPEGDMHGIEFLEKFIDVKLTLIAEHEKLQTYFKETINNTAFKIESLKKKVIEFIDYLYKENDYHQYVPFLGNIRKIKLFINALIVFDESAQKNNESQVFDETDIDANSLCNLLLIYIHYPKLFKEIYDGETLGKNGLFSAGSNSVGEGAENSERIKELLDLDKYEPKQKFLLKRIFDVEGLNVPKDSAAFNGDVFYESERQLEKYLYIIAHNKFVDPLTQKAFHEQRVNEFLNDRFELSKILENAYPEKKGDFLHEQFWDTVYKREKNDVSDQKFIEIFTYALNEITQYSLTALTFSARDNQSFGFRYYFPNKIMRLLNQFGTNDQNTQTSITDWIFGENKHKNNGVLQTLAHQNRGVLGVYDLMNFTNNVCWNDSSNRHDILVALNTRNGTPDANIINIDFSEIKTVVYKIFKERYIDGKINFLKKIDELEGKDLYGKYTQNILENEVYKQSADQYFKLAKSYIKATITDTLLLRFPGVNSEEDREKMFETILNYLLKQFSNESQAQDCLSFFYRLRKTDENFFNGRILEYSELPQFWVNNRENLEAAKRNLDAGFPADFVETINALFEEFDTRFSKSVKEERTA